MINEKVGQQPEVNTMNIDDVVLQARKSILLLLKYMINNSDSLKKQSPKSHIFPFSNMSQSQWKKSLSLWKKNGVCLIKHLPKRECPVCSEKETNELFTSSDGYPYVECLNCTTWFVPYVVDNNLFNDYFKKCPEAKQLTNLMIENRAKNKGDHERAREMFDELDGLMLKNGIKRRYLDIGCGVGTFVAYGLSAGYDCYGIDSNPIMIETAKNRNLNVYDALKNIPVSGFDIITMIETIEHMVDPSKEIMKAVDVLNDLGLLIVSFPNLNSTMVRLMRGDCMHVFGGRTWPGHINLFNEKSIRTLFDNLGLEILDLDGEYGHNFFELMSYVLGDYRGYFDLLNESESKKIEEWAYILINNISPYLTALEQILKTSPVLRVIACKKGKRKIFKDQIKELKEKRWSRRLMPLEI